MSTPDNFLKVVLEAPIKPSGEESEQLTTVVEGIYTQSKGAGGISHAIRIGFRGIGPTLGDNIIEVAEEGRTEERQVQDSRAAKSVAFFMNGKAKALNDEDLLLNEEGSVLFIRRAVGDEASRVFAEPLAGISKAFDNGSNTVRFVEENKRDILEMIKRTLAAKG